MILKIQTSKKHWDRAHPTHPPPYPLCFNYPKIKKNRFSFRLFQFLFSIQNGPEPTHPLPIFLDVWICLTFLLVRSDLLCPRHKLGFWDFAPTNKVKINLWRPFWILVKLYDCCNYIIPKLLVSRRSFWPRINTNLACSDLLCPHHKLSFWVFAPTNNLKVNLWRPFWISVKLYNCCNYIIPKLLVSILTSMHTLLG